MKALRLLAAAAVACAVTSAALAADKFVAITQIVEHPALDACRNGVKDELAAAGYEVGKNLKWSFESAQGNPVTAAQIAKKFVGDGPDVIVAIATPSAQAAVANTKSIPVVFSAVTDPVGAKLVSSWEKPGKNVTGTSDMLPLDQHLKLVKRIVPAARNLGIIFNPGEANSVSSVEGAKKAAPANGLAIVEASAPNSGSVLAAARSLVGKVDAIYIPTDNTVVSAFEAVVKVGIDAKIPVFAADTDSVPRGAAAALGFNYYEVGRQTGRMVVKILEGEKPGNIPVAMLEKLDLFVNPGSAGKMGVTLPAAIVGEAKKVVE